MKSDIEIARSIELTKIKQIARGAQLSHSEKQLILNAEAWENFL